MGVGALTLAGSSVRWRDRARGLPPLVRRGIQHRVAHRLWSILGIAVQRSVASASLRTHGADLATCIGESVPQLADLSSPP